MPIIQDIFAQYGGAYLEKYGKKMPAMHKKALKAIMNCRSKSLGGEVWYCSKCQEFHYSYHSCQNRHCVVCQNDDAADWISKNKKMMLPFTYFLATFTMPEELRNLCQSNQKLFYNILFSSSSDAIKLLAKDEKYLGADIGMIGILHTWTRALIYHAHVHYLVPGGGIGNDGKTLR
ncbi:MAG: transposase zinc-binding domain-containing protein, partial [Smithella sp.]|nr:transposase zinc-binding domain-containing protein [Smithella sp.]